MKTKILYRFIIACFSVVFILSCSKDDNKDAISDNENTQETEIVNIVSKIIRDSGLNFPESNSSSNRGEARPFEFIWPAEDYVSVDIDNNDGYSETILVKIWLDPNYNIIPTASWRDSNSNFCMDQGKYMRPAKRLIQFKIHNNPRDDIRYMQLKYMDLSNNASIEHALDIDVYENNPDWIQQAMSELWDELLQVATVKDAVEPCDNVIPMTLHFSSTVTFDTPDTLVYEELEFTISLTFDEATGAFIGSNPFVWTEGYAWSKHENMYIPYPTIQSGNMEIMKLLTPELVGNSMENTSMTFRVPHPSPEHSSILLIVFAEFYTFQSNQGDTVDFIIDDWQSLDDPEIVMAAYRNNQLTLEDGVITESTIFEITR